MPAPTAKALLLDFGGVISKTLFETQADIEAAFELKPGTLNWFGPFAPEKDVLWTSMQAGEISERQYWYSRCDELSRLVGYKLKIIDVIQASRGDEPQNCLRPEAIEAVNTAKRLGVRVGILSNELELFYGTGVVEKIPFLRDIDHIVDATHTKILKPDPRAYESAMAALNVAADQIVFVDDQIKNIRGAESAGFDCVQFDVKEPADSFSQAIDKLCAVGQTQPLAQTA